MTDTKKSAPKSSRKKEKAAHKKKPPKEAAADEPISGPAMVKGAEAAEAMQPDNDRLLRLQADFDNYRKRTVREREQIRRTANKELIEDLLPVLDHFEMGMANAGGQEVNPQVIEGFQLVYDQLLGALKRCGLEVIAAEGEVFDPHVHEAITHLPSEEHPADVVMTETRRGYTLGDLLLRASQVVVSRGPRAEDGLSDEAEAARTGEEA